MLAFLAACSSAPSTTSDSGYLLTVNITGSDTQETITQKYGGEVIAWMDNKAILKMSQQAVSQLQSKGTSMQGTTIQPNTSVATPVTAAGWNAWAGGWNAWAGGWNAWAGGWNAWAGGLGTSAPADNNTAWNQIKLREAHAISRKFGQGIKVAVIDSGIDLNHPMFSGRLVPSSEWRDFVDGDNTPQEVGTTADRGYGHGTAVASIILQIAPKSTILPIRVLDQSGGGNLDQVIQAINYAVNDGASVINLSLGTLQWSQALQDTATWANSKKVYIFSSVGNGGNSSSVSFPGGFTWNQGTYRMTIGVGSVNASNRMSTFTALTGNTATGSASNAYGDIWGSAPGEGIVAAFPGSQTASATGTSFAAPMFSGAAALAFSEMAPTTDRSLYYSYMWDSFNTSSPDYPTLLGAKILNVEGIIRRLPGWTQPVYQIVNQNSGLCLDVTGASTSTSALLQQATCSSANSQRWKLNYAGGYYSIANVNSSLVVDVPGFSTTDGKQLWQWTWGGNTNQQWTIRQSGNVYNLVALHDSKCMGISGGSLSSGAAAVQWTCNGSSNQNWRLQLVN